jgi:hypothetical protein
VRTRAISIALAVSALASAAYGGDLRLYLNARFGSYALVPKDCWAFVLFHMVRESAPAASRKIAAILVADVVGADEDRTLSRAQTCCATI